jgi:hypothetical protein
MNRLMELPFATSAEFARQRVPIGENRRKVLARKWVGNEQTALMQFLASGAFWGKGFPCGMDSGS